MNPQRFLIFIAKWRIQLSNGMSGDCSNGHKAWLGPHYLRVQQLRLHFLCHKIAEKLPMKTFSGRVFISNNSIFRLFWKQKIMT